MYPPLGEPMFQDPGRQWMWIPLGPLVPESTRIPVYKETADATQSGSVPHCNLVCPPTDAARRAGRLDVTYLAP